MIDVESMIRAKRGAGAWLLPAAGAAGLLACVSSADAATVSTILFDDTVVQGGLLSYDGSGGPLTAAGVMFDSVFGMGTASNDGVALTCEDCMLSLATGANVLETASFWAFAPGGSVMLTGTAKDGASTIATGTLLSGYFNDTTYTFAQGSLNINVSGSMDATLDADLAAFYATPTNGLAVMTQINIKGPVDPVTNAFQGTSTDTDINYYVVPVPTALPLFFTALAGIAMIGWRRDPAST